MLPGAESQPNVKQLLSTDHFSVDGTLMEAWASMKSLKPKRTPDDNEPPASGGRNEEVDFRGETRSNQTHASTSDPDAMLYRKGSGMEAKLCFIGHALMENRHGLFVDTRLTRVSGRAERLAALDRLNHVPTGLRPSHWAETKGLMQRTSSWSCARSTSRRISRGTRPAVPPLTDERPAILAISRASAFASASKRASAG